MHIRRSCLVVLDGVGIGALPDADRYGDAGSNTLVHTAMAAGGLVVPHLARWGLGRLASIPGVTPVESPAAAYGLLRELSAGKDTTTGHWELAGLLLPEPFPTFPHGFPPEVIDRFSAAIGRAVLGNRPASGTEILAELGAKHLATGYPIVYTSADSVFQVAAHEDIVPLEELYRWCRLAREILQGPYAVGRVIARPFIGRPGAFVRTAGRKDFSLPPPAETILDRLAAAGFSVIGLGKIEDIFAGRGLTKSDHTPDNRSTLAALTALLVEEFTGLVFANCVDFDTRYGHRNDPHGFAAALTEVDAGLGEVARRLRPTDLLLVTADHGCDPTTASTDHSREYVPLLAVGPAVRPGFLGTREGWMEVGATSVDLFGLGPWPRGRSFATELGW
ncbi:MAG: phosphopentomutase [Firmicutes bacterium]|nr:phosphopentomutase [Bacillota bacterium]